MLFKSTTIYSVFLFFSIFVMIKSPPLGTSETSIPLTSNDLTPEETSNDLTPEEEFQDELCKQTQPTKDIIEDCTEGVKINEDVKCCYVTTKYKKNKYYSCEPVEFKKKEAIKKKINELKEECGECKSVKINCDSNYLKIALISLIFFLL